MSDQRNDQTYDQQDTSEALDEDVLVDEGTGGTGDPVGDLLYPPERPLGVDQYGTTPAEEQTGEPLDERARRDLPDRSTEWNRSEADQDVDEWPIGRLVEPGADDDGLDLIDIEAEAIASRADIDERDLSAEEAAVHLTADPPLGDLGDGYLEEQT